MKYPAHSAPITSYLDNQTPLLNEVNLQNNFWIGNTNNKKKQIRKVKYPKKLFSPIQSHTHGVPKTKKKKKCLHTSLLISEQGLALNLPENKYPLFLCFPFLKRFEFTYKNINRPSSPIFFFFCYINESFLLLASIFSILVFGCFWDCRAQ